MLVIVSIKVFYLLLVKEENFLSDVFLWKFLIVMFTCPNCLWSQTDQSFAAAIISSVTNVKYLMAF